MKSTLTVLALAATLSACATYDPDLVRPYQAQRPALVQDATVLAVRPVTIDGYQTGGGAAVGGVIGGVAGSQVGGYRDGFVIGVLGAVIGSVIGNAIERDATRQQAIELTLQMQNGQRLAVVQGLGSQSFAVGDPVQLVSSGGRSRVTHAASAVVAPRGAPGPALTPLNDQPVPMGVPMPVPRT